MPRYEYDVFISHATEDKATFVRPLVGKLGDFGLKVWYDEFSLEVGDSLSGAIAKGLAKSKYGVVVLSKAFLQRGWPEYELRGLISRQVGKRKVILPIWHGIEKSDLLKYSPSLADLLALNSQSGIDTIVVELLKVIAPRQYRVLEARRRFDKAFEDAEVKYMDPKNVMIAHPRVRERITDGQLIRLRIVNGLLGSLISIPFEKAYDGYLRDLHPENELQIWERSALITAIYRANRPECSDKEAKAVLFLFLMGDRDRLLRLLEDEEYRREKRVKQARILYRP